MKAIISVLLLLLHFNPSIAQYEFEFGYFINNEGVRTECLIKNEFWKQNPNQFEYKLSSSSETEIVSKSDIKEFGITDKVKFIKTKTTIEILKDKPKNTNDNFPFRYQEKELFLKVLEEGKASLYEYKNSDIHSFFFKVDEYPIKHLVYISRIKKEEFKNTKLEYSRKYKVQLYENLKCDKISIGECSNLRYNKHHFINIIRKYNTCKGGKSLAYKNPKNKSQLYFKPKIGVGVADFSGVFEFGRKLESFEKQLFYRVAIEFEYITTLLDGSLSFILEPGILRFSKNYQNLLDNGAGKIDFSAVQFPVGIRFNYKTSKKSRIYISALYEIEKPIESVINYNEVVTTEIEDEISSKYFMNYSFGIGSVLNNLNFEIRYHPKKSGRTTSVLDINYTVFEFIAGYQL